jgi:hypothetical protein
MAQFNPGTTQETSLNKEEPGAYPDCVRNFPCQTLKISKVSLVVMGS